MFPVCISLCRSQAVPLNMIIIRIEFKEYSELRHIAQLFYRIIGQRCLYSSISGYLIGKAAFTGRRSWQDVGKSNLHAVFVNRCLRSIGRTIHTFSVILMTCVHAGDLPLCITHLHQTSAIIICRCSPEVGLRDRFDHFSSCIFIRNQATIENREQHFEIFPADTDVMKASHKLHATRRSFRYSFHLINMLAESNLMPCLCPECFFSEKEGYGYRIFARALLFSKWKSVGLLA